jgi:hypothetical protein
MPGATGFARHHWSPGAVSPTLLLYPENYNAGTGAFVNLGSGGNGSQPTGGQQPTASTLSTGAPAVAFDGIDDVVSFPTACRPTGSNWFALAVVELTTAGSYPYVYGSAVADTGHALLIFLNNTRQFRVAAVGAGTVVQSVDPANANTLGVPAVLSASYDGTTLRLYVGLAEVKNTTGTVGAFTASGLLLGARTSAGGNPLTGKYGGGCIVNSLPGAADRARLIRYFGARTGVSV